MTQVQQPESCAKMTDFRRFGVKEHRQSENKIAKKRYTLYLDLDRGLSDVCVSFSLPKNIPAQYSRVESNQRTGFSGPSTALSVGVSTTTNSATSSCMGPCPAKHDITTVVISIVQTCIPQRSITTTGTVIRLAGTTRCRAAVDKLIIVATDEVAAAAEPMTVGGDTKMMEAVSGLRRIGEAAAARTTITASFCLLILNYLKPPITLSFTFALFAEGGKKRKKQNSYLMLFFQNNFYSAVRLRCRVRLPRWKWGWAVKRYRS